jgi:hypothetical protein
VYIILSNSQSNNRFNGRGFDGATFYYEANRALPSITDSEYWFAEFPPVNITGLALIHRLLEGYFNADICGHVGGSYPTYVAGVISLRSANIFIALKPDPWLNLILQRWEEPLHNFYTGPFT